MDGMNNRWFPGDGRDVPLPGFFLTSRKNVLKCIRQVIVYKNTKAAVQIMDLIHTAALSG
jgi:hypothetical protein